MHKKLAKMLQEQQAKQGAEAVKKANLDEIATDETQARMDDLNERIEAGSRHPNPLHPHMDEVEESANTGDSASSKIASLEKRPHSAISLPRDNPSNDSTILSMQRESGQQNLEQCEDLVLQFKRDLNALRLDTICGEHAIKAVDLIEELIKSLEASVQTLRSRVASDYGEELGGTGG